MYIFTVLAFLLAGTLWTITHAPDIKDAVGALLNIIAGGLLALLGTVVNHEFGAAKRDVPARAGDVSSIEVSTKTTEIKP